MLDQSEFISSLKQVELFLRPTRHSRRIGIHELAHRGRSLEFAGYQEYRPGDDLKDLDWKLFARTDRYYVKQRDTHTPASTLILLDDSPSMGFRSDKATASKFRGALLLAFGLGYVLYKQGDAFSFQTLFTQAEPLKPRSSKKGFRHLVQQLQELDNQGPTGNPELILQNRHPQSVDHLFLISDFLVPETQWNVWIKMTKILGRKTTFFRVLDPEETAPDPHTEVLNIEQTTQHRFLTQKDWNAYRSNFQAHEAHLRQSCLEQNIAYHPLITNQPMETSIRKLLYAQKGREV